MKSSVINTGKGILSKCLKSFCLVVAIVVGLCGDVWGEDLNVGNNADEIISSNRIVDNAIISGGRNNSSITIRNGATLTINGNLTINGPSANANKYVDIQSGGTLIVKGDVIMTTSGNGNGRDCFIRINNNSTVTIDGDVTMAGNANRNYILFAGDGTLNLGGSITSGRISITTGGGATNTIPGTVNYINKTGGTQTVLAYTYYKLTLSEGNYAAAEAITVSTYFKTDGTLTTASNITFNGETECGTGKITASNGTVNYTPAAQYIIAGRYNELSFSNANTKGIHTVCGDIEINGRANFANTSGTEIHTIHDIDFNYTIAARNDAKIFASGTSTVTYGHNQYILGGEYNNIMFADGKDAKIPYGDITVNGVMTWNDNRFWLYNGDVTYNVTFGPNAKIISSSGFGSSHYFAFPDKAETGFVTVKGNVSDNFAGGLIPIGNANTGNYRPVTISAETTSESSFSVRPTNSPAVEGDTYNLKCYWITESENISDATLTFTHIATDKGSSSDLFPYYDSGSGLVKCTGAGSGYENMTITFTHCTPTGKWTACEDIKAYYSFTSGDWNNATSWTFDPAGIDRTGANIPATGPTAGSRVIIKNPDIITVSGSAVSLKSLTIYNGGVLDLGSVTGHNLGTVNGQGTLKLASNVFPNGTFNTFVSAGGGTVEYYNNGSFTMPTNRGTYNNLVLNITGTATLCNDIKINGNFSVNKGTFQIGNSSTVRTITVCGNLIVKRGAEITTGDFDVNAYTTTPNDLYINRNTTPQYGHILELQGDFINDGTVSFTRQNNADYTRSSRRVTNVFFTKTTGDQNVVINGTTKFYTIRVQKGIDKTHVLNIDAAAENQFFLLGPRTGWHYSGSENKTSQYFLALAIEAGTVRLGQNITINALIAGDNNGYKIDETACLWIDGATVAVGDCFSLYVHGDLRVSNGQLNATTDQGIVYRTTANITLDGGRIESNMLRTSKAEGAHVGALTINDGIFKLTGNDTDKRNYPTFGLTYPDGGFNMTGGELIIERGTFYNGNNAQHNRYFALAIGINTDNCNITGGTLKLLCKNWNVNTNYDFYINSTVPFWDVEIEADATANEVSIKQFENNNENGCVDVAIQPLVVLNNLTIKNNGTLDAINENVFVGGNFTIESSGKYTPGTNTTFFNGSAVQNLTVGGTITNGLNNLTLAEGAQLNLQNDVLMRGTLTFESNSVLNDLQHTLTVSGNLVNNSGTHYNSASSTGCILLDGDGTQTIGGDGHGSFNNLHITASTVTMTANTAITGNLRLLNNNGTILNIGTYNLNLVDADAAIYSNASTGTDFSATKMVQTSGHNSDGGITRLFSTTGEYLFPFGFDSYYLPAVIAVDVEPTTYGTVTSRPVSGKHYVLGSTIDALQCYWHNTSNGFSGVSSVNHYYYYNQDLVGAAEGSYIPAYYKAGMWYPNNNNSLVYQNSDYFKWESCTTIDGDFTCGVADAFSKAPDRLFSVDDGDWNDTQKWVDDNGDHPTIPPGSNTVVVINHNMYAENPAFSGSLTIAESSSLDLRTSEGHSFGVLTKNGETGEMGTIIIHSNNFPGGDFGEFLSAGGGTIEYNASANSIPMPAEVTEYNHLKLTASGNNYVTMPNADIEIHGNLTSNGNNDNGYNRFNTGGTQRTVTVDGNLTVGSGTLAFSGSTEQNLIVRGNIKVDNGANFSAKGNGNRTNQLTIYGNMDVDGTLDFTNGQYNVATTFTGTANDTIKGTGDIYLYTLTCDKGSNATPVLSVENKKLRASGENGAFLNLLNGTFRADGEGVEINITEGHDFELRSTACLSAKQGTLYICNVNDQQYNVNLHGKIEVLGEGQIWIGNGNNGNDIEYQSSNARIDIQGGNLIVSGQIRRSYNVTTGDLHYSQSGGNVVILGKNRDNGQPATKWRGLIEVCNNGSFNMTDGTLTIADNAHSNDNYIDILLTPASSSTTGGTLIIGTSTSTAGQTFIMNASAQLASITVGTDNCIQTLKLVANHVDINGSLSVNRNSVFNANGYNVNIAGDLFSYLSGGFVHGGSSQITTFDGTSEQIIYGNSGTTNIKFSNLTISNPTTTKLTTGKITVDNLLTISRGAFDDGGNTITAKGNVLNDSRHISSTGNGSLTFEGNGTQEMASSSGKSGTYGNLIIKKRVEMKNPITITGSIELYNDIYANDYQVKLMQNAAFIGTGSGMIILNGSIGDAGVRKYFANEFSGEFLFRIGVPDQYTPAKYIFTTDVTSDNGYINIKPMNNLHAAISNSPAEHLNYYWMVNTEGLSGYTVTHEYYYTDDLLTLEAPENESSMIPQNYINAEWKKYLSQGSVDADNNMFKIETISELDGEYTIGNIYYQLPPYFSVSDGPWGDMNTWEYYDSNGETHPATAAPAGNPITIRSGHKVTIEGDTPQCAYSLNIEEGGKLDAGSTIGHNFGIVRGGGTLMIGEISGGGVYSFMIPAGKYDDFFSTSTSTINFYGDNAAVLPAKPGNFEKPFQNVLLSGSGPKKITASVLYIKGNLTIDDGCQLDNSVYNRDFFLGGDFIDKNTEDCGYTCGTSKVIFNGIRTQKINIQSDANFYNIQIDNAEGVDVTNSGTANKNVNVSNNLILTNGNFLTCSSALIYLSSTNQNVVSGGGANSFVDGPLTKKINLGGEFNFPVGNGDRYGNVKLTNVNTTDNWTVQYYNNNPKLAINSAATFDSLTIKDISENEYWVVTRPTGGKAKVGLRWDDQSCDMFNTYPLIQQRLKLVEYDGSSKWNVREATTSGTATAGMLTTTAVVEEDNYIFTFGFAGVIAAITTTDLQQICNDGEQAATINVSLSGSAPFTLTYSVNGTSHTQSGISTSPYQIVVNSSQLGSTVGTYNVLLESVSDASGIGTIRPGKGQIEVLTTYTPTFTDEGGVNVAGTGETRTYEVVNNGNTYLWAWAENGPELPILSATDNIATVVYGDATGTYNLVVTETTINGEISCPISRTLTITVSQKPQPSFTAAPDVCMGDEAIYTTPAVGTHTYAWTIATVEGEIKQTGSSNSISVNWNYDPGDYKISIVETNGQISSEPLDKYVTVYALPSSAEIENITSICSGTPATVTLSTTESNVTYKLYRNGIDNALNTISGNGQSQSFTTPPLTETGEVKFYATAANPGCTVRIPQSGFKTLMVNETPDVTLNWPVIYKGVETVIPYTNNGNDPFTTYRIDYTAGGTNKSGSVSKGIIVTANGDIAGTITINNDNCSVDIPFSQPMADGYVWSGEDSPDWNNTGNWYSGSIPTHEHDAIIRHSDNYQPQISDAVEAKSVKIESGVLTINDDKTLSVYGDWQNDVGNEGFVGNSSTVAFINNAEISGNTIFNTISAEPGNTLTINNNGHVTVNGDVENAGTLIGNDESTLELAGIGDALLTAGTYNLANLKINKTSGNVTANAELKVNGEFAIYGGILDMNGNTLILGSAATTSYDDDNESAFVNGEMTKIGVSPIVFPIGNNERRAMVGIVPDVANASTRFTASYTYIPKDPDAEPTTPDPMDEEMVRVSKMDNWQIKASNGASAKVTLYWDNGSISEITKIEYLTIAHWNGSKWEMLASTAHGSPAKGYIQTTAAVTSFSPFTFGSTELDYNPLPVELVDFTGRQDDNVVVLEWATLSEKDNDYFEIERSTDGVNFVTIGFVQGAGNSTDKLAYSFADNAPEQGRAYYRLSQVDYDGSRSYADRLVSVVYAGSDIIGLTIVPNPTHGQFRVRVNGAIDGIAKLLSQSGTLIRIVEIHSADESIDISDLPNGIFILQYQTGENVVHERIIKL